MTVIEQVRPQEEVARSLQEVIEQVIRFGGYMFRDTGCSILELGMAHPTLIERNVLLIHDNKEFMTEEAKPGLLIVAYEGYLRRHDLGEVRPLTAREAVHACVSAHVTADRRLMRNVKTSSLHWGGVSHRGSIDWHVYVNQRVACRTVEITLRGSAVSSPFQRMLCVRL